MPASQAFAVESPPDPEFSPASGAYFGSSLDWSSDTVSEQTQRLGRPASVLEHAATLPISKDEATYLGQFFEQVRHSGALAAITLGPGHDLSGYTRESAVAAVDVIAGVRRDKNLPLYIRFAPNMNANWVTWGQRPKDFVAAFRIFADVVHSDLPNAVMVWSPASGSFYPFRPSSPTSDDSIDTDHSGTLDSADDPYEPYYPGNQFVDWVGLSAYFDASGGGALRNAVPGGGELDSALRGGGNLDFYDRYARTRGKPLMLETAAFFSPGAGGPAALEVKQAWWRQVIAATTEQTYPLLKVILWRDSASARAVIGEVVIDWSISDSPETAAAFTSDASTSGLVFGPVVTSVIDETPVQTNAGTITGIAAWIIVAGVILTAVGLTLREIYRRKPSRFVYEGPPSRDLRIDMLRGVAITFVVVNHLALISIWQNFTQEAIGFVSGAELFVLLSGAVLGLVHRPKIFSGGIGEVTLRTGRRALKLYVTAIVVVCAVGVIHLFDFVKSAPATTYTDGGTGAAGTGATGRVYNLYANFDTVVRYPVPPNIISDIAMLRLGPWQVNVLGLYVVMLIIAPLILWALGRRRWLTVLLVSGALYLIQMFLRVHILPSQFEDSFPLLTWQFLFVIGMVAGFHRREILKWFGSRVGQIILAISIIFTVLLAILSWNNPYLSSAFDVRLGLVPPNVFSDLYSAAFERTTLDAGRITNVLLVVITAYAVMTAFWRPLNLLFGWFFVPLGQATLYVFIVHVLFILIVANVPALGEGNVIANSAAYIGMLGLIWVMVRTRFLFKVIPQ